MGTFTGVTDCTELLRRHRSELCNKQRREERDLCGLEGHLLKDLALCCLLLVPNTKIDSAFLEVLS